MYVVQNQFPCQLPSTKIYVNTPLQEYKFFYFYFYFYVKSRKHHLVNDHLSWITFGKIKEMHDKFQTRCSITLPQPMTRNSSRMFLFFQKTLECTMLCTQRSLWLPHTLRLIPSCNFNTQAQSPLRTCQQQCFQLHQPCHFCPHLRINDHALIITPYYPKANIIHH